MAPGYTSAYVDFRFEIINLPELDAAPLLQSDAKTALGPLAY
jgi:hypothetical protein